MIPEVKSCEFVSNMEQVLDVYKRPYNSSYPVICMDESPKQLIRETRPSIPMKPGREFRVDYEYVWDNMEDFQAFGQILVPILQSLGVDPAQPEVQQVHNIFIG